METIEDMKCIIKCHRNADDVTQSIHPLKYGVVCTYITFKLLFCI